MGRLYRSATPQFLTVDEARQLAHGLGVRTRVDLRGRREAREAASPALAETGMATAHLPLYAARRMAKAQPTSSAAIAAHYLGYLEHSGDTFARIVRLLGEHRNLPVLVHCAAGKDGTGAAVALILAAAGARPRRHRGRLRADRRPSRCTPRPAQHGPRLPAAAGRHAGGDLQRLPRNHGDLP